jgi:hypothetical protein
MDLRETIESTFGNRAFERPLLPAFPGGIRLELSEGGTAIRQVFVALRKAEEICESVFEGEESIGVCLRFCGPEGFLAAKGGFRELRKAEIRIPGERCFWTVRASDEDEGNEVHAHHVAFHSPKRMLINFLWCAFAQDFGSLSPRPGFQVYLFSLGKQLWLWPYDDRGMDVVGPNREALRSLRDQFQGYLLQAGKPKPHGGHMR